MSKEGGKKSGAKKAVRILIAVIAVLMIVLGIFAVSQDGWIGIVAIVAGAVILVPSIRLLPLRMTDRYNPLRNKGEDIRGEDMQYHPEDVPVNPWDRVMGQEEDNK